MLNLASNPSGSRLKSCPVTCPRLALGRLPARRPRLTWQGTFLLPATRGPLQTLYGSPATDRTAAQSQREDDQRLTCNPRRRLSGVIAPSGVDASAVRTCAGLDGYATATRVCPRLWSLHPTTAGSWSSGQPHTLTGCRVVVSKGHITAGDISGGLDVGWIATGGRAKVGR